VKSLLTGEPLFGHFPVRSLAEKAIFLTPEASMRPFFRRLKKLGLDQFIGKTLHVRTLTRGPIALDDPGLLEDAKGADIFLDTLVRFNQGDENDASDVRQLSEKLFALQAAGARTIWASHHSVKTSTGDSEMTLENMVRGSGDLGAMISNCYALRKIDPNKLTVFVQCVKRRDDEPTRPFIVEGVDLRMVKAPGEAGVISDHTGKKSGRPEDPSVQEKKQLALKLQEEDQLSVPEIAEKLNETVSNTKNLIRRAKSERDAPSY